MKVKNILTNDVMEVSKGLHDKLIKTSTYESTKEKVGTNQNNKQGSSDLN